MIDLLGVEIFGIELFITLILLAFIFELFDASLGMGYGTTFTPILLIIGFGPLAIIPSILLSQLISGITAGVAHHKVGNVNFKRGSMHLKIVTILTICSIIGATLAVVIALNLPEIWLKTYIGLLVLGMGILILLTLNRELKFSWKKITGLGLLAAFNKGMSGGGYGPVVTGGQILSGVNGNNAVGITCLAEGLTCIVGVIAFIVYPGPVNWSLAPSLIIGTLLSVPFSTLIVKKLNTKTLRIAIGVLTFIFGIITLIKIFFF